MAWQPNIPQGTDQVDISQADIQGNFQALDPIFNGINNFLKLPVQGSAPTTSASQVALYSANDGFGSPQLFYEAPSSAFVVNLTGSGQATNGWARLPSRVLIKWGTIDVPVNTLTTVTFPAGSIPAFASIFYVSATQTFAAGPTTSTLNTSVSSGNMTTTTFQVWPNATTAPLSGTISIRYMAIGA